VLILIVPETRSGLKPGLWLERLVSVLEEIGIKIGWLFQDEDGTQVDLGYFEEDFYLLLFELRERHPELFKPDCNILDDYQLPRSH